MDGIPLRINIPEGEQSIRFCDEYNVDTARPGKLLHQVLRRLTLIELDLQNIQGACLVTVPFLISIYYTWGKLTTL